MTFARPPLDIVAALALAAQAAVVAWGCGLSSEDETGSVVSDSGTSEAGAGGVAGLDASGTDAPAEGSAPDAAAGAAGGGAGGTAGAEGGGGGTPDASDAWSDAAGAGDAADSSADAANADAPVSQFCGDGVRDPVTEECDDGPGSGPADSCSNDCRVQDVLVLPGPGSDGGTPPSQARSLGRSRHPVAAGGSGFAVAMLDTSTSPYVVRLRAFSESGTPGPTLAVATESLGLSDVDPCVAALPGGKYAVAYTDLGADGDARGVALKVVDPSSNSMGPVIRVNGTKTGNQDQPDALFAGGELVVAFTDQSKSGNFRDVKVRRFDASGASKGGEEIVSATTANEASVALAPFAGSWVIAYRSSSGAVSEKVVVRSGATEWSTETYPFGPVGDRPALAELDSTHLLLVYTTGGASGITARLRGMVIDTSSSAPPTSFEITPLAPPYAGNPGLGQTQANVVRAGKSWFVAWRSQAVIGTVEDEELWLKALAWSSGAATLDLSAAEIALPRSVKHRVGDQQRPALAASGLLPGGALVSAWDDHAKVFGSVEGLPDVVAELIPLPVVRLPAEGGLE